MAANVGRQGRERPHPRGSVGRRSAQWSPDSPLASNIQHKRTPGLRERNGMGAGGASSLEASKLFKYGLALYWPAPGLSLRGIWPAPRTSRLRGFEEPSKFAGPARPPAARTACAMAKQRALCVQRHGSASNADATPLECSMCGALIKGQPANAPGLLARSLRVRGEFGLRKGIRCKKSQP